MKFYKRITEHCPITDMLDIVEKAFDYTDNIDTSKIGNNNIFEVTIDSDDERIVRKLNELFYDAGFVNSFEGLARRTY